MSAVQTDLLVGSDRRSRRHLTGRKARAGVAGAVFAAMAWFGVLMLGVLLFSILRDGLKHLDWQFITSFASRKAENAGIKAALVGSVWMLVFTALISVPLGVAAAIYLEEYARKTRLSRFIEVNISNLAGVPSIVYGLLGLTIFVYIFGLGRSVIAGSLTMSLLVLPVIITASREAIKAVPASIRHGAFALGATRWQVVRNHVLPSAVPGILTGVILSMSRAIGEAAPMVTISALAFIKFTPVQAVPVGGLNVPLPNPMSDFTVLPIQIYNWASRPQAEFQGLAAAGIIVLLVVLLVMNSAAVIIRNRAERKIKW